MWRDRRGRAHLVVLGPVGPVDEIHEHGGELPLPPGRGCGDEDGEDVLEGGLLGGGDHGGRDVWPCLSRGRDRRVSPRGSLDLTEIGHVLYNPLPSTPNWPWHPCRTFRPLSPVSGPSPASPTSTPFCSPRPSSTTTTRTPPPSLTPRISSTPQCTPRPTCRHPRRSLPAPSAPAPAKRNTPAGCAKSPLTGPRPSERYACPLRMNASLWHAYSTSSFIPAKKVRFWSFISPPIHTPYSIRLHNLWPSLWRRI